MKVTITRQEILKTLPYGSQAQIAKEAGVSFVTVWNWFNSLSDNIEVERIALTKYHEIIKMRKQLGYAPRTKKNA